MTITLGFDVYGTLVDPLGMRKWLASFTGAERAAEIAQCWRVKQIEYAFRRAAMGAYADFLVCTRQALLHTFRQFDIAITERAIADLLDAYLHLPAYADVLDGLRALAGANRRLVAFSNGPAADVRTVLANAEVLPLLDDIISVDEVRTFKPAPAVYHLLVRRGGAAIERTWLISSNAWDVIGAKHAGLRALWLKRDPSTVFDPWDIEPDGIAPDFSTVAALLNELTPR